MNPFPKFLLIVGIILAALLLPGAAFPLVHGAIGGVVALLAMVAAILAAIGLGLLAGGATLIGLLVAIFAVALGVFALLSPILIPLLLIAGVAALIAKSGRPSATPASVA